MNIEQVADILYEFLRHKSCPRCSGSLKLEVRRKKGHKYTKQVINVICGTCGLDAVCDDYGLNELFDDKLALRGKADNLQRDLQRRLDKFYQDVADRMMESA